MAYEAMFRLRIAVFGMLLLLCLNANVLAARSVRVGIYDNAPKIFINEEQEPDGIFIDVLNEIARREAWDLEYLHGNWDECLERLASGEIDLMPDVAFTAGRAEIFSFHDNQVFSSWSQVFARQGSNIKSILDLDKKRVSVLKGSVHIEKFLSLVNGFGLDIELVEQADFDMVMEAISRGKADAAIVNSLFGMVHARHYLLEDTAIVFNPSTLFFATAKGQNTDLLIAIDKHMTAMKQNPSSAYYQSLKRWTGEEVKYRLPHWVLILLSLIIGILAFSVIIGFILKRQVRLKTAELRESNFEMEKNIILRTSELAAAMEKAQVADNLKSAFLATMSHELRTPLNSIIGFTGIMLQEMPGPLNDEQKKQLNMVKSSARHLLSLINDVLDISKIEAGQLELFYESFDLRTSLVEMIRLVIPLAEKKGIELISDIDDSVGSVVADKRRIEQIILNLLSNAVKFTDKGYIHLKCVIENGYSTISVKDTGIGMKPEDMTGLFTPFSQIDSGLTRKYEGTGLGLSICKKLLDMMQGSIKVQSEPNLGSTFTISFPVSKEESNV